VNKALAHYQAKFLDMILSNSTKPFLGCM